VYIIRTRTRTFRVRACGIPSEQHARRIRTTTRARVRRAFGTARTPSVASCFHVSAVVAAERGRPFSPVSPPVSVYLTVRNHCFRYPSFLSSRNGTEPKPNEWISNVGTLGPFHVVSLGVSDVSSRTIPNFDFGKSVRRDARRTAHVEQRA